MSRLVSPEPRGVSLSGLASAVVGLAFLRSTTFSLGVSAVSPFEPAGEEGSSGAVVVTITNYG